MNRDSDLMINVLSEAKLRSERDESVDYSRPRPATELALIIDLLQVGHVRGTIVKSATNGMPVGASLDSITLSGRELLDRLQSEKRERSILSRGRRGLVLVGSWAFGKYGDSLWAWVKHLFS